VEEQRVLHQTALYLRLLIDLVELELGLDQAVCCLYECFFHSLLVIFRRLANALLQLFDVFGLTFHELLDLLIRLVNFLSENHFNMCLILEWWNLWGLIRRLLILLLDLLDCVRGLSRLQRSCVFLFYMWLYLLQVNLRGHDHLAGVLVCVLGLASDRRLAHRFLLDHFLDLLHREADDTPSNLYCLCAIGLELDVLLLGQDQRAELREVVFELELAFERIVLYQGVTTRYGNVADAHRALVAATHLEHFQMPYIGFRGWTVGGRNTLIREDEVDDAT